MSYVYVLCLIASSGANFQTTLLRVYKTKETCELARQETINALSTYKALNNNFRYECLEEEYDDTSRNAPQISN